MTVCEAHGQQLTIRRKLKYVGNELLEDLDEVQGPCVVVPQMQEARVTADSNERQLGMTAESMNRRVKTLQNKSASSIVRRQLVEEPRLHEYDQGRAGGDEKVGALEIVLHASA